MLSIAKEHLIDKAKLKRAWKILRT
jgi:hypothetical protein